MLYLQLKLTEAAIVRFIVDTTGVGIRWYTLTMLIFTNEGKKRKELLYARTKSGLPAVKSIGGK